jgi:hypothetical protein
MIWVCQPLSNAHHMIFSQSWGRAENLKLRSKVIKDIDCLLINGFCLRRKPLATRRVKAMQLSQPARAMRLFQRAKVIRTATQPEQNASAGKTDY